MCQKTSKQIHKIYICKYNTSSKIYLSKQQNKYIKLISIVPKNEALLASWKCSQKQFSLIIDSDLDGLTCVCNNAVLNIAQKSSSDFLFAYVSRQVRVKMDSFLQQMQ